jgi:uncharacterized protein YuzE
MKIEYDPKHDIMNIYFIENEKIEESVETEDGVIIDYGKGKMIVSIEILDVSKRTKKHPLETIQLTVMREKEIEA